LRQIVVAAVVASAAAGLTSGGWASERLTAMIVLTPRQLDSITAAASTIRVEAFATAHGPTAVTSTEGSARSGQTTVLRIDYNPRLPEPARAKLLGIVPAEIYVAQGQASATGATDARASVNIVLSGNFAYLRQASETTATTTSVFQAAAAFAIALLPGSGS
jgi:hypothetical protein